MPDQPTRLSTRDLIGPTLVFFAALLITAAIGIRPLVSDDRKLLPLDLDQTTVAEQMRPTDVLDHCSLKADRARVVTAHVQQRRRIVVVQPSDDHRLTLQAGTSVGADEYTVAGKSVKPAAVCAEPTLFATIDRTSVDRTTARPTSGASDIQYDAERGATEVPDRDGQTYVFGYDTYPEPERYFDPVTRNSVKLDESEAPDIDGRPVHRYTAAIPDTDLSARYNDPELIITRPARWFGEFPGVAGDQPLTATLHHRAFISVDIDTATGIVLAEDTELIREYRFTGDEIGRHPALADFALTDVHARLHSDQQTQREAVALAKRRENPVILTGRTLPLIFGGVGGVLLVGGIVAIVRRPRDTDEPPVRP